MYIEVEERKGKMRNITRYFLFLPRHFDIASGYISGYTQTSGYDRPLDQWNSIDNLDFVERFVDPLNRPVSPVFSENRF